MAGSKLLEEGKSLREGIAQVEQSLSEQLVRTKKWLNDHGYDIEAHRSQSQIIFNRLERSHDRRDEGVSTAADGGPGSAVNQIRDSATGRAGEDLDHIEFEVPPKEPEDHGKSGGYTHENAKDGELESQAGSQ
ncbi:hypothetical protein M407DRAFT_28606 [Tulasnella calospora MUT 4182]|uniref:Uncharacterized protein n=1 Tax=Tulasnella calospora MUT 4182 TaxID=1051891 RepID=A0A0C3QAD1_9AGAM|nr:hypothetical protein M407DRAFT_28606 [Tulasnella calospora MUT 4182]